MLVWPKNDEMRKILKHANGTKFRETGPVEWPDDSFTYRRVTDGDVLLKEPSVEVKPKAPDVGKV